MKIRIFAIEKSSDSIIKELENYYKKLSSPFAKIELNSVSNKEILKAQQLGVKEAQNSYTKALKPHINGFSIALDPLGESVDSKGFAKLLLDSPIINFFIGGAYGFEAEFLNLNQKVISLSRLTYAHKIAKVVLLEQIYRGLSINGGHPYHK